MKLQVKFNNNFKCFNLTQQSLTKLTIWKTKKHNGQKNSRQFCRNANGLFWSLEHLCYIDHLNFTIFWRLLDRRSFLIIRSFVIGIVIQGLLNTKISNKTISKKNGAKTLFQWALKEIAADRNCIILCKNTLWYGVLSKMYCLNCLRREGRK